MYFDGFFVPNTIIIENSKLIGWYFSSDYDPFVLKKGKEHLFPESIMNSFVKGVQPTEVIAKVTYVDLVLNSTVVAKTEYMTPPQLQVFLNQLQTNMINAIVQQVLTQIPELRIRNVNPLNAMAVRVRRAVDRTAMQHGLKTQKIPLGDVTAATFQRPRPQMFVMTVLLCDWRPDSLIIEGRRSKKLLSDLQCPPNERVATYFSDISQSTLFAPAEHLVDFVNQALARFGVHVHIVTKKPLTRLRCYLQVLDTPETRQEQQGDIVSFLHADVLEIGDACADVSWAHQLRFNVLKKFEMVRLLDFKIVQLVVNAFSASGYIQSNSALYQRIYRLADETGSYITDQKLPFHERVLELMKNVGVDSESHERQFRVRYSDFFVQLLLLLIADEQFTAALMRQEAQQPAQNRCVRCEKTAANHRYAMKLLLTEPLIHFEHCVPALSEVYKGAGLSDCYALVYAAVFGDATVLEFRDQIRYVLKEVLDKDNDGESHAQKVTVFNPRLLSLLTQNANLFPETTNYFNLLKRLTNATKAHNLDLFRLSEFFDVGESSIGASAVPNRLLRRAGVVKQYLEQRTFLKRLDREDFVEKKVFVCKSCVEQLLEVQQKLAK